MTHQRVQERRSFVLLLCAVTLLASLSLQIFIKGTAHAAQITARSLTLQAGAGGDGGSMMEGEVNHLFGFTVPTTGNVGSIKFEYCTLAYGTCTTPTDLITTAATLGAETGITGFTLDATTNGAPFVTRTAASVTGPQAATIRLDDVINPSTEGTFYVRISTYTSEDTLSGLVDTGVVVASTAEQITLTGTMPESLVFCTGADVATTLGVPDCSTATSGAISFNQLFSPTDTATAISEMAASTNAGQGYAITVNGVTLSSGSNTIPAMGTSTTGVKGTGQFGLNLKANTTSTSNPAIGAEVAPAANGTEFKGQAVTGYNSVDNFKFTTGDVVADSANGGAGGSNAQIFRASYIVNVAGNQAAGTYTTTLTYICTATF